MSKRDLERKRKEEQEATAHVFKDFIDTFQNVSACAPNKTFVRSEILYADGQNCNQMGQIYNPKPLIKQSKAKEVNTAIECAKLLKDAPLDKVSKKFEKPKSNLDLLKEEIKQRHLERGEKDRIKDELELPALSYFDGGDPNSTNLFITNLSPKITESNLMVEFGMYGPLASVKIMWPRGDDKSFRGSHCGFVAFMSRKDAERALLANKHRDDMRVGWGKSVEIPTHPIYIPNDLLKLYLPPLQTGLPFNAQPPENYQGKEIEDEHFLEKCSVKVTVPLNKKQLMLIHRMVEFVVREGPMFEAFIMNQEIRNSDYSFLFDYQSPLHIYYRWKVFSILNGDHQKSWRLEPFRMFKGGSIWLPPVAPDYTKGMPEELIKNTNVQGGQLSENQCARLIGLIRELTLNRTSVAEAMVFCVNHSGAIDDALEIILESLTNPDTRPVKKIARMYLFSDVVTNCRIRKVKLKLDDNLKELETVFDSMQDCYLKLSCAHDRDNFRYRIQRVITYWTMYNVFPRHALQKVDDYFTDTPVPIQEEDNSSSDEPLDGASLLKRSMKHNDIGPEVQVAPAQVKPRLKKSIDLEYFVPSKWDTVDPEEVEAQAMSTEKLYYMEAENQLKETKKKHKRRSKSKKLHR
ncbi:unnamed protein product [Callosobruchus maculatus]|uniref:RRM domain-containing protein n=1 Tax=Callosobruchus maculatus TaxID=64391 RepID=A0A653DHI2_CALMS|nr:unnamed protein product [Callosobruchus maculatus]